MQQKDFDYKAHKAELDFFEMPDNFAFAKTEINEFTQDKERSTDDCNEEELKKNVTSY